MSEMQAEWSAQYQRYLKTSWSEEHQRYYWLHHVEDKGWVFFSWPDIREISSETSLFGAAISAHVERSVDRFTLRQGHPISGSYTTSNPLPYEKLDPSFQVQHASFFQEGRVFAILFTEPAGNNAINSVTDYNSAISMVQYGEWAHTQVRRFIVARRKREHCYSVPIFTYGNQATKKPGVAPSEHAIVYSQGHRPTPLSGEQKLDLDPICVVTPLGERPMSASARIYFGIHHPIQYNVKVKDLGNVLPSDLPRFLGYWVKENGGDMQQDEDVPYDATIEMKDVQESNIPRQPTDISRLSQKIDQDFEAVSNPRAFFKKGRVFVTPVTGQQGFTDSALFAVVKPKPTHAICLPISRNEGDNVPLSAVATNEYADVVPVNDAHLQNALTDRRSIYVKVENDIVSIEPGSRINFAKPSTLEYNIKIRNIGRVIGDSVGIMEERFAEGLGLTKARGDPSVDLRNISSWT